MDGAAIKVKKLATRILPHEPHHLTVSAHGKYPVPANPWSHSSKLQYTTFLFDVDRGVLLTRPYYEIIEEPPTPAMSTSSARPGSSAAEPKKKISLADYRKQKKPTSQSPPDSGPTSGASQQPDTRPAAPSSSEPRDSKSQSQSHVRKDASTRVSESSARPTSTPNGERHNDHATKLPAKPTGSPLPDSRKRIHDPDDSTRPQKRVKSDSISKPEVSRPSQSHGLSKREDKVISQDKGPSRDARMMEASTSTSTNGASIHAGRKDGEKATASPRPTVNGVKGHATTTTTNQQITPKKSDDRSSKSSLPPLLSPLRLELGADQESEAKAVKKRPAESSSGHLKPPVKAQKTDAVGPKKQKSPLRLPPLLSPTLPAIVEQELARIKKTPSKGELGQSSSQGSDTPNAVKKPRHADDLDGDKPSRAPTKPSLIVTLKYKKRNAKAVQRLLALKPRPRADKEFFTKEKSEGVEDVPSPARKRPAPSDAPQDSVAIKRPKMPAEKTIGRSGAPQTPLKSTPLSREPSRNSLALTPSGATGTPGDRPNTGHGDRAGDRGPTPSGHRRRAGPFNDLGTKLKHERDAVLRSRLANGALRPDASRVSSSSAERENRKLVAALSLEMMMAYFIGFGFLDLARELERKPYDLATWEGLLPHLPEVRAHAKGHKPLEVMVLQIQAQIYEQINKGLLTQIKFTEEVASKLASFNKKRNDVWNEAHRCLQKVNEETPSMTTTIGPWLNTDATVRALLPLLRRWCQQNKVAWEEKLELPSDGS